MKRSKADNPHRVGNTARDGLENPMQEPDADIEWRWLISIYAIGLLSELPRMSRWQMLRYRSTNSRWMKAYPMSRRCRCRPETRFDSRARLDRH